MTALNGVVITKLKPNVDDRGRLTEVFRSSWPIGATPVQWNVIRSRGGVLRGFHVHVEHFDYVTVLDGELFLGLRDIRRDSPTKGRVATRIISGDEPVAVTIPPGVAHGFSFSGPCTLLYAVSRYWDREDELVCRWDDPTIGIDWPITSPRLSERDGNAGSLAELIEFYEARRAALETRSLELT